MSATERCHEGETNFGGMGADCPACIWAIAGGSHELSRSAKKCTWECFSVNDGACLEFILAGACPKGIADIAVFRNTSVE